MRRILHFVADINVDSGMISVVMNYYRHMDRSRVQFDFLYFADGERTYAEEIRALGGRLFRIDRPSLLSQREIRRFFQAHSGEFCALHCHPIWSAAVLGGAAHRSGIRAVLLHSHSGMPGESRLSAARNRLLLHLGKGRVDRYFACSQAAGGALRGITKEIILLPNAIDIECYAFRADERAACRRELGIPADAPVVGHVGRMVEVKNHGFLLRAFAALVRREPSARLLLVGDGPLEPEIRRQADALGLADAVCMTGARADMPRLYAAMDVFAMPSLAEGLSMALLEAQASGLPCVVANTVSGESDVTHRMAFAPLGAAQSWADALQKQLRAGRKKEVAVDFRARNLSIDAAAGWLMDFYERIE